MVLSINGAVPPTARVAVRFDIERRVVPSINGSSSAVQRLLSNNKRLFASNNKRLFNKRLFNKRLFTSHKRLFSSHQAVDARVAARFDIERISLFCLAKRGVSQLLARHEVGTP